MDFSKLSKKEKIELLNKAKDAYYNSGEEILSDAEYDELERSLDIENKAYVGSSKGNYTVKHSFICGSLSKSQVKEQKDRTINWDVCCDELNSFLHKSNNATTFETTPKLDGCSFSAEFKNQNGKAYLYSVGTRGNGEWGSDIRHWFEPILNTTYWSAIDEAVADLCDMNSDDILCIRGEVLVKQSEFSKKYVEQYANPRAFVAGMLGIKYSDATEEKLLQGKDLHFVCYDYRLHKDGSTKLYEELSWMNPNDPSYKYLSKYVGHIGELPDMEMCQVHQYRGDIEISDLIAIYKDYDNYRKNNADYALDGIVFKPACASRQYNENRPRPVDCIALKFLPMINSTRIIDIEWNIRKTGEYFPTGIVEPILMPDGKKISRASLHNYGWIVNNNCGIGSSVRISLAGDIIPFVYEIVERVSYEDNINLPEDGEVVIDPNSGAMHYMKQFSDEEKQKNQFLTSCMTLNINTVGPVAANELYDVLHNDIPDLTNVIYIMNDEAYHLIYDYLGTGKSIKNIVDNLKKFASYITLYDIIRSFNFKQCGNKAAEVCTKIITGEKYSTASLPAEAYQWALNTKSREYYLVTSAAESLNVSLEADETSDDGGEKVKVILTGSPDAFGYKTKGAFMQAHPGLEETTSWKEVEILITDDLGSNSGKMQKAKKGNITIKTYGDFDNNAKSNAVYKPVYNFNESIKTEVELF